MSQKGFFILFEGPDRSGKTTQVNMLSNFLKEKGFKVIVTREPGGTEVSEKIRDLLLDPKNKISPLCELFLYEASRAQHVFEKIKPALDEGHIVICDRFTIATEAYQGYGRNIDLKTVRLLNDIATMGLKPDLVIGFDISDEEYKKRKRNEVDRIEMESDKFRERVNSAYSHIFREMKNVFLVDASKSVEDIHEKIKKEVLKRINGF